MSDFPTYQIGTVSVANGGTVVTGDDVLWSGVNARSGDEISIDGLPFVKISDVTDFNHLTLMLPWEGADKTDVDYIISMESPNRYVGAESSGDVQRLISVLNSKGLLWYLDPFWSEPDEARPYLTADDGQAILKIATGELWVMQGGSWVPAGTFKGFNFTGAYDSGATYAANDVVTSAGSAYIVTAAPPVGTAPPNASYYALLASKGDKGDTGNTATIAVGTVTSVAYGQPATVTNVGTSSAAVFDIEIPKGQDGTGTGDMEAATYDPTGVAADAFDINNMRGYVPTFKQKSDAVASNPASDPSFVQFLSQSGLAPDSGGQQWLGRKVGSAPSHDNYITIASGAIYERVPAVPSTPASVTELGMIPNQGSGVDMTPYFNKVLTAAKNSGFKNWYVPLGGYYFNTQPNAIDFEQFRIRGHNRLGSVLYKNFVSNGTADAILSFRKGYFSVAELGFVGMTGSQLNVSGTLYGSGSMISAVYQSGDPEYIGYCSVSDCNMTSDVTATDGHGGTGACVYTNIYLDGSAGAVPAVRAMTLNNIVVFGAETASVMFLSTQGIIWNGGETSRAGGKSGKIYIEGTSGVKAAYTQINLAAISDGVQMIYTDGGLIQAGEFNAGVVSFASTCIGTTTMGYLGNGASVSNSGSKCRHISPNDPVTVSGTASIAAGSGTAISFGVTFAAAPRVTAMIVGANTYAYGSGVSTTGITLISASGTQTVHWTATGVLA